MAQEELEDDVRGLKDGISSLLDERRRRSDVVMRVARLLRFRACNLMSRSTGTPRYENASELRACGGCRGPVGRAYPIFFV